MRRENTISMIRGNSNIMTLSIKDSNGNDINLKEGDKLYFTVKRNTSDKEAVLQKEITIFEDGNATIDIRPEDTRNLYFGKYLYDIRLDYSNGDVITLIKPAPFVIEEGVSYE